MRWHLVISVALFNLDVCYSVKKDETVRRETPPKLCTKVEVMLQTLVSIVSRVQLTSYTMRWLIIGTTVRIGSLYTLTAPLRCCHAAFVLYMI